MQRSDSQELAADDTAQTGRAVGASVAAEPAEIPAVDASASLPLSLSGSAQGEKREGVGRGALAELEAAWPQRPKRAAAAGWRWPPAASRQVLLLRLRAMKQQFEGAETAAQVQAAWERLAARLRASGVAVDARQCMTQFAFLHGQWQAHCASVSAGESRPDPPLLELLAKHFGQDASPGQAGLEAGTAATSVDVLHTTTCGTPTKKQKVWRRRHSAEHSNAELSKAVCGGSGSEELARADEILSALEKQSALLERQARAQQERADVMQKLLQVLAVPPASQS